MVQRCPECGAATEDAPWCGACGARLAAPGAAPGGSAPTDAATPGRARVLRTAVAVAALVVVGAVAATSGREPSPAPLAEQVVPVEDAEVVVAPSLPGPGVVGRQFAASGSILWERTDLPASQGTTRSLVGDGRVVAVLDGGEPVFTVDATTGGDVARPPSTAPPDSGLTFVAGGQDLEVEVGTSTLRGVVAGEVVWEVDLHGPPAAPPVRTGTSLVVALSSGEVVAIAPVDGSERWRRDLGSDVTAVDGDGTVLLAGTADGRVLRLDPSGTPVTTVRVGEGAVRGLVAGRPAAAWLAGSRVGFDRLVGFDVVG